jgi:hypothetical protein
MGSWWFLWLKTRRQPSHAGVDAHQSGAACFSLKMCHQLMAHYFYHQPPDMRL